MRSGWRNKYIIIGAIVVLILTKKCSPTKDNNGIIGGINTKKEGSINDLKGEKNKSSKVKEIKKLEGKKENTQGNKKLEEKKTVLENENIDADIYQIAEEEDIIGTTKLEFPEIKEEMNVLFEQGFDYDAEDVENKDIGKGKILASIDPMLTSPKLNVIGDKTLGKNSLSFYIYSNYLMYLESGEIEIYEDSQGREKIDTLTLDELKLKKKYEIDLNRKNNKLKKVYYRLIVRDKKGRKDETEIKELDLTLNVEKQRENDDEIIEKIYDTSSLKIHQIPVDFYKVRFYGKGFKENNKIILDGQEILVDDLGNFAYEMYYLPGEYNFEFKVYDVKEIEHKKEHGEVEGAHDEIDENETLLGEKKVSNQNKISVTENSEKETVETYLYSYPIDMKIDKNYHFLVGIADVKVGRNKVEKQSELLLQNKEYDEGMFNEGRLAFYTRNRIGKYSIVAQMDTENQELKHIFDGMGRRDNREIFKDMEREDKGYTFGDDSYSMMDVDSQGQFYVRVEWDKNKAMWGNYSSSVDNGEYLNYSKTLYGAQFIGASQETTSYNEDKYSGTVFFSNPETLSEYNIFLATGGSLYYLQNRDLVEGSEEVTIEVINQRTGQKVKEVSLSEGKDYAINNIQGRIILNEPLFQYGYKELGDVIKDSPISDFKTYLKVQYEYYDRNGLYSSDYTTGGSGKYWINDNVQLGGAYVKSTEIDETYELQGLSGVLRKTNNTYVEWEYAQSKGRKMGKGAYSTTGGLNFKDINYIEKDEENSENIDNKGSAYKIKGVMALNELSDKFTQGSMAEFWFNKKDGGFSVDSLDDGSTDTEYGFKSDYIVNDRLSLTTEFSRVESKDEDDKTLEQELSVQGNYGVSDKMSVSVALRGSDNRDSGEDNNKDSNNNHDHDTGGHFTDKGYESDGVGKSVDLGVTLNYQFTQDTSGYIGAQKAITTTKMDANDVMGNIGGSTKFFDKLTITGDYSAGNEESAGIIQASYAVSDYYETYVNLEQERMYDGTSNDISFGQKVLIGEKYEIFQENQLNKDSDSGKELTQVYGINVNLTKDLRVGIGYEQGDLDDEDGKTKRNSVSTSLYYDDRSRWKYNNRLEMIRDKGNEDYTVEWLTVNDIKYKYNEEWTAVGKLDFSITEDKINGGYDSKFMELGIGGAYRPIWNDRLNMLWKYTYIYDLNGVDEDSDYSFGDLDERSNIFSIDAVYSLTKKLDIGGKWAYKKAEMKAANDESEWFDAQTTLYAVSLSYNFYEKWRVSGEYHWLISNDDNERKEGIMAGIDYDVHQNLRVGIGYNFTDFSDDLRYDDYRARGVYINIIGVF
ncbi:hypothetical protein [Fusobacterium sp.]|uniref:hypothetical protein n=1 Tax=Fusobacterium sp. TaxID=68766 RepID=UPI002619F0FD|nr:hypothetical protein [Fusobacterium sp.]